MSRSANVTCVVWLVAALCLHGTAGGAALQFGPKAGEKRTVRLAKRMAASGRLGQLTFETVVSEVYTLRLEAVESAAEGSAAVNVTFEAIKVKIESDGRVLGEYDSTESAGSGEGRILRRYAAFIGRGVTVGVSPQGRIVESEMESLFLALAESAITDSDAVTERQFKEKAREMIETLNKDYGSREKRVLARKKELEESPTHGKEDIRGLLSNVFASLPGKAVETGGSWKSDVLIEVDAYIPIPATCTVKVEDTANCTIDIAGQSPYAENPYVYEMGAGMKVSNQLAGSYEATVKVDSATGWLHESRAKAHLTGLIVTTIPNRENVVTENTIDIMTTVEEVQP
jgi:hypothetical protein